MTMPLTRFLSKRRKTLQGFVQESSFENKEELLTYCKVEDFEPPSQEVLDRLVFLLVPGVNLSEEEKKEETGEQLLSPPSDEASEERETLLLPGGAPPTKRKKKNLLP